MTPEWLMEHADKKINEIVIEYSHHGREVPLQSALHLTRLHAALVAVGVRLASTNLAERHSSPRAGN